MHFDMRIIKATLAPPVDGNFVDAKLNKTKQPLYVSVSAPAVHRLHKTNAHLKHFVILFLHKSVKSGYDVKSFRLKPRSRPGKVL